MLYIVT